MITLDSPITQLIGIGDTNSKNLNKLGIKAVSDLLFYFPYKHLDFSVFSAIKDIRAEQTITVRGTIKTIATRFSFRSRTSLCEAIISDETGSLKVTWFNQPYIKNYLKPGDEVLLSGKATFYKHLQLSNPIYEKVSDDTTHTGRIVPVYHLTENVYNKSIRTLIKKHLHLADSVVDDIPKPVLTLCKLLPLSQAIRQIHFPESDEALERAKLRISFNDGFIQQLAVQKRKHELANSIAPKIEPDVSLVKKFLASLPFTLTAGQKQAAWQIMQDMEGPSPMNRLLEGDVGSGKTLVAILSALAAIKQNFQVTLLAPTEILAKQHYQTITKLLYGNKAFKTLNKKHSALVTNNYRIVDGEVVGKKEVVSQINKGKIHFAIGTHALLYGQTFKNLGLIIIDEQHRFGVEQRATLLKQQKKAEQVPHLLSMTATPIPRTLALALYDDLQTSILKQVPSGRKPIITKVVTEDGRAKIYEFISKEIKTGKQTFIITPRVEDSETSTTKSVKAEFKRLSEDIFPKFKLGLLYGKMKASEKEKTMEAFNSKQLDILVATSVIEIGIDVPNATTMIIEGAQNFGLAQLHQLRGRVGRGPQQSYCFLFSDSSDEETLSRLSSFASSNDGFKLAEMDLAQRGFGDLFGQTQTGFQYKFSRFMSLKALQLAKQGARLLMDDDPTLKKYPILKAKAEDLAENIHFE